MFNFLVGGWGGSHIGCMAAWVLIPVWHTHKMKSREAGQTLCEGACPIFALCPCIALIKEEKSQETCQGSRKAPTCMALCKIHCVALATGLWAVWTRLPTSVSLSLRLRRRGSTLCQRICRVAETRGSPDQLTLSRKSWLGLLCGWRRMKLQSRSEFPVTSVPR